MYQYATLQSFFSALRYMISEQGLRGFEPYYDEERRYVGLRHMGQIYSIRISTARCYYSIMKDAPTATEEAKMFAKDVQQILDMRSVDAH